MKPYSIEHWQNKKQGQHKANKKFVRQLRQHKGKALDRLATEVDQQVFEQVDCLDCAGCCKGLPPIINKTDSQRIAKRLGMKQAEFDTTYLTIDEDQDTVLKQTPCPFLLPNNHCSIYEFRPKACREYPHTATDFSRHLNYHATNTLYCPASFYILDLLKKRVPF